MQNVLYVAKRWRYARFVTPLCLCGALLPTTISYILDRTSYDPLRLIALATTNLIIVAIITLLIPIHKYSVELSNGFITGPTDPGFRTARISVDLQDINLQKSQCSFWWGSYLLTYSGKKIVLHSILLGMEQIKDLFVRVRHMQKQFADRA